jgi:hypothetical protein
VPDFIPAGDNHRNLDRLRLQRGFFHLFRETRSRRM